MSRSREVACEPFPATQWSLVQQARDRGDGAGREALALLLRRYLPALRAHLVYANRIPQERADDLLQGFVADKVIEQNLLDQARQAKGRFRTFLLVTLERYVVSAHRAQHAAKRCPAGGVAGLDDAAAVADWSGGDAVDPFNLEWAQALVAEALSRMRGECEQTGRGDLWRIFDGRIVRPAWDDQQPVAYGQLVQELNLAAPLQACALLTTAKRMFLRCLRSVAAEYADPDAGADEEIEDLRRIVASAGRAQSGPRLRS